MTSFKTAFKHVIFFTQNIVNNDIVNLLLNKIMEKMQSLMFVMGLNDYTRLITKGSYWSSLRTPVEHNCVWKNLLGVRHSSNPMMMMMLSSVVSLEPI